MTHARKPLLAALALLAALGSAAEVAVSDIWRWGLVRRSDLLPPDAQVLGVTGGVIRVAETRRDPDGTPHRVTNDFLSVSHPVLMTNGTVMADGVLNGTNGVFFARPGAGADKYWILFP